MIADGSERGGSFYDNELLDAYLEHRHAPITSPNLVMEDPAFRREAGSLTGLRILDLGCGDGTFAAECAAAGCASYLGIDGAPGMIDRARDAVASPLATFLVGDIEDFEPAGAVDLVVARMSLHYVADLLPVLVRAGRALDPGGRLVTTVIHPVVTAAAAVADGPRREQVVNSYFDEGVRHRKWFGREVRWQHRTVATYLQLLVDAGFELRSLDECAPVEHLFAGDQAEYQRRRQVPLFLLLSAVLPP